MTLISRHLEEDRREFEAQEISEKRALMVKVIGDEFVMDLINKGKPLKAAIRFMQKEQIPAVSAGVAVNAVLESMNKTAVKWELSNDFRRAI